jgi:hypothetical protein
MASGALNRLHLVRNDISEKISPPSSGFLSVIGPYTALKTTQKTVLFDPTESKYSSAHFLYFGGDMTLR